MDAFILTIGVVFVAELGDKSQLMAVAAAARHPVLVVLPGIALAAAAVHALSVVAGRALAEVLSGPAATVVAGLAFLGFAAWTLLAGGEEDDGGDGGDGGGGGPVGVRAPRRTGAGASLAIAATFFVSEVGDKTMLATAALAARQGALATWAGATVGMVAADGLAIVVGRRLAAHLPETTVRRAAAAVFAVFGVVLVVQGLV